MSDSSKPYKRFVPRGHASLVEDAPGWGGSVNDDMAGPVCWKCHGCGSRKKPKESINSQKVNCSVCGGRGCLAPKRKEVLGASCPGTITRGRRRPDGWQPRGPAPHALAVKTKWSALVEQANQGADVVPIKNKELISGEDVPSWIPQQGEQLCNLVGSWRLLQRVGSHRWTTDDLVTAYVASREVVSSSKLESINYLDLGTGNASVLQMVTWALIADKQYSNIDATGVEARLEAVTLARRSLLFNLGKDTPMARIVHGDFRDVCLSREFELITGTPPYFRVDFAVNDTNDTVVKAVINQGGMPTAKQSAPARCEFRGGIEAYCEAASRVLREGTGRFVVCENWLNHSRVVAAAEQYNLQILTQVEVQGRQGRETLFAVYVMKCKDVDDSSPLEQVVKRESLAVRDHRGRWTRAYRESVLEMMSIPEPDAIR